LLTISDPREKFVFLGLFVARTNELQLLNFSTSCHFFGQLMGTSCSTHTAICTVTICPIAQLKKVLTDCNLHSCNLNSSPSLFKSVYLETIPISNFTMVWVCGGCKTDSKYCLPQWKSFIYKHTVKLGYNKINGTRTIGLL